MMKKLYLALSMGLFVSLYSQTVLPSGLKGLSTENYVFARTYLDYDTITNQPTKTVESVTYYDGLGRPKQSIAIKASPTGKDVVTTIPYDGFGRQVDSWLPVPMSSLNGGIQSGVETAAVGFYNNDPKPFARKKLKNSPLDRIDSLFQVGSAWSDHPVVFDYGTNKNEVKNYTATFNYTTFTSTLTLNGQRPANTLYKNTVNDEDGNTSIEYKNGEGQTILIRKLVGFKNSQGIAAPMAPIDNNIYADTYYVYNDYNQLSFVIPPLAVAAGNISTATKDDLCYQYIYDGRNRLVEKKLPGKGWEYMVYDNQDRLVMTQDANMGTDQKWLFTKYDQFGRVAYTGIYVSDEIYDRTGRNYEQEEVNGKGSNNVARTISAGFTAPGLIVYYDNLSANNYPNTITEILSVNYYDTYPPHSPTIPATILSQPVLGKPSTTSNISTKGLPTASFVKNIGSDSWTKNYTYYDQKGRPIRSHSINHLGGYTKVESKLDFSGVPHKTITYHRRKNVTTPEVKIEENFTYDHQNRLIKHEHTVNNENTEILAENTYNEIGQLIEKKVGNNIQEINYAYNIRGWMTGINLDGTGGFQAGKLFNYKINYNNPLEGMEFPNQEYATPIVSKWNGNISEILWKTQKDPHVKRYGYVYDPMNRLLAGLYQSSLNLSSQEHAEILTYDLNGNIKTLKRSAYDFGTTTNLIDHLKYDYHGNRLLSIVDNPNGTPNPSGYEGGGNTIAYDDNGNMTDMLDKGIENIEYNFLNLPNQIDIVDGYANININTLYNANGVKLKKTNTRTTRISGSSTITDTTDYLDGFQYLETTTSGKGGILNGVIGETELAMEREAFTVAAKPIILPPADTTSNAVLQFVPTAEGFYDFVENKYIYHYKDHLGNTRLSYAWNTTTNSIDVLDQNDYYPFGMNHLDSNSGSFFGESSYKNYKYNGKELQETGMYDYGARMYMPDIGRWGVIDNKAEKYFPFSGYNYAINNPIKYLDPDGNDVVPWFVNSFKSDGSMRMTKNYATKEFNKAMTDFAKTDYGKSFLLSFMKQGQSIYGLTAKESGKNSESNLNLINLNLEYATGNEKANTFMSSDGAVWEGEIVLPSDENKLDANVYFDTNGVDQYSLGETITHEVALHGSHYDKAVENAKKGDKKSDPAKNDHKALKEKDTKNKAYKNYETTMKQLIKQDEKYKKDAQINE